METTLRFQRRDPDGGSGALDFIKALPRVLIVRHEDAIVVNWMSLSVFCAIKVLTFAAEGRKQPGRRNISFTTLHETRFLGSTSVPNFSAFLNLLMFRIHCSVFLICQHKFWME